MTAVITVCRSDAAYLITDGIAVRADGVSHLMTKAWPIPHLRCAVAARGPALWLTTLAAVVSTRFASFAGLRRDIGDCLKSEIAILRTHDVFAQCWQDQFEFYVAGWCFAQNRAVAIVVASDDHLGIPAWTAAELPGLSFAPSSDAIMARFKAAYGGIPVDDLPVERAASDLIGIMMANPIANCGVGGFAQVTRIAPSEISTRSLLISIMPERLAS